MTEPKHVDGRLKSLLSRPSSCNSVRLTAPEAEHLKALVPGIQDTIATIECTIERTMKILTSERDAQIAELERIQAAIAPHKKLPIEILTRIFALCGPTTRLIPEDLEPRNAPWTLRQVCSTWRQLALSQNSLWNDVSVSAHPSPDDEEEDHKYKSWGRRLQMAQEILPQTGLVSISLESEYRKEDQALQDIENALHDFVAGYADRLLELAIMCPFYGYVTILEVDPSLFQRIESLALHVGGYHQGDLQYETDQYESRTVFRDTSRLRKLSIRGEGDFLDSIQTQNMPWTQLTNLTFEFKEDEDSFPHRSRSTGPTWNGFLPVLSQCNNLTSCKLRLWALGTVSTIHITLPYLRSLTLNLRETNPLASLTLPSLERLHLIQKHLSPLDIASLVERSGCTLRVIIDEQDHDDIGVVETSAADYDYLLQRLEHIQELRTLTVFETSDIIQIAKGTRLPLLENVQFAFHLPKIAVLEAFEHGFNLAPQVVGSARKLRNVICEYGIPRKVVLLDERQHTVPVDQSVIEKKLSRLLDKYGVSLQFSSPCSFYRIKN